MKFEVLNFQCNYVVVIRSGKMIRKTFWCILIFLVISENHCSPSDRDLYAFSTVLDAVGTTSDGKFLDSQVQDSETAATNLYTDSDEDDSREDPPGPEDHVIPYTEHEDPGEVPTRPKYEAPGVWAKPDPKKNIPLDFVPTKSLAQVRGTHTIKVLPQSDAIATATTDEERENAPRLRKVVSNKKTNTIYTEEGYEDSAYDHAGHVRDADFHEGFARKLHDQRTSKAKSGANSKRRKPKKKKQRNQNLEQAPKEFDEFEDDYRDERSEQLEIGESSKRNDAKRIHEDAWKRPDVNPKYVTESEVKKLEDDLKREAEEVEKGSEINAVPDLHQDDHEETSSSSEGEGSRDSGQSPSTRDKQLYTENHDATTTQFETPTPINSQNYETSTLGRENSHYHPEGLALQKNHEATTFTRGNSQDSQPVTNDAPTTVNYGELFWNYYQSNPYENTSPVSYIQEQTTIQQPVQVRETTSGPYVEENPSTIAAVNGHGGPDQFGYERFLYYPTVQNGHQYLNPNAIPNDNRRTNGQSNSGSGQRFDNFIGSHRPVLDFWKLYKEQSQAAQSPLLSADPYSAGFYDDFAFSVAPDHSVINLPPKQRTNRPQKNSNQDRRNRERHQGLPTNNQYLQARQRPRSNSRIDQDEGPSSLKPRSEGRTQMSFFGYKPDLSYTKMLDYIRDQEYNKQNEQKSESANLEDFTIMKPPAFGESVFSDFTLNSYPNVVDYSSGTQESEAVKKTNRNNTNSKKHNGSSQSDIHSDSPVFYGGNLPVTINQKQTYPASRLLPPPLNSNNHYVQNNKHARQPSNHNHGHGGQNFRPYPQQLRRYSQNGGPHSRYTRRSDDEAIAEVEIADAVIAQEISARFNSTSGIPQNQKSRPERDATHQDLLDASHKTAGDVIDGEISSRFKDDDHDAVEVDDDEEDEEDEEGKREKIVEVDVPDLDYIDEIQDVNEINIPSTTPAGVDLQKYPFYENTKVPNSSPLKYIINPKVVPKKTLGGMEFYDSRDRYIQCDELGPNLDGVLPDEEEPVPNRGPKQNLPRLRGLGDKLDCFKAKFFGENPFDNPIFSEKKIVQPTPPSELDPIQFALQISKLPKENKDQIIHAQSRKPESMSIKRIDDDNRSAKSQQVAVSEIRNKRRKNVNHSTVREYSVEKPERTTRNSRQRRPGRRLQSTTTELPDVKSVTPYEKEVYEDVMGTIKNLASLYEIYGPPNQPPATEKPRTGSILSAASIRNVKTVNRGPSSSGKREMHSRAPGMTENPSHEEIEGLLPPPEPNKKPRIGPYRTDKVSYNTRVRTENPSRNGDKKIVGYFRTVRVHKRSVDGDGTASSTSERPKRRRKTNLTSTPVPVAIDATGTETRDQTPKPYYSIRSRSKNSKDGKSTSRYGLFTTTEQPSTTTDRRRNEPRYAEIMRRRGQPVGITTTTPSSQLLLDNTNAPVVEHVTESVEIYETENSVPRKRKVSTEDIKDPEFVEENEEANDEPFKKAKRYDVRENVQEDTTVSAIGFLSPTKSSEFTTYPFTDPPVTSAAFEDEPNPKFRSWNSEGAEDEKENYRDAESKEELVEEDEEVSEKAPYQEDDTLEDDVETPKSSEGYSSSDSAEEPEEQKKNDEDDMTFFRYESRPESPFESFEDDKYSELGPRINKPAFNHPAFKAPKRERSYFDDTEEDDREKADDSFESGKFVFPWAQDEEDEKLEAEEGYVEEATEKYEYPWDKRERLAKERKERRERRKYMESVLGFTPYSHEGFDEDEKEGSSSEKKGKQVYPWDRYDLPSRQYKKKFWTKAELDSDETSSEHRPITKFSSKYSSSKFRLPSNGKALITTVEPKKIRESVLTYLKEADEASTEPTEDIEPDTFTTNRPEPLTTTTAHAELTQYTHEPAPAGSKSNNRISNSRIVPEDITAAPRQKVKKLVRVRERTTLKPSVKSTKEAVKVEKQPIQRTVFRPYVRTTTESAKVEKDTIKSTVTTERVQTTTASVTTRRRPSRRRGYKAQESQTVTDAVLPTPETSTTTSTSTTEKPVEPSVKIPGRFIVRKRGKAKAVSSTESSVGKNRQKVGVVTEKSTKATTTKSRRTRPTIATRLATIKRRPINDKTTKKPSLAKSLGNSGDRNIEDSTPTSRTVEHRSRVSTEEIITKTSFPKEDRNYKAYKDTVDRVTPNRDNFDEIPFADSEAKKSYSKTPDRGRKNFDDTESDDEYRDKNESVERTSITTKETPEHIYEKKEILDKDGNKGMFISIIPKNRTIETSEWEDELNPKKTKLDELEEGKDQNYNYKFDENETQKAESNGDDGSVSQVDVSYLNHRRVTHLTEHVYRKLFTSASWIAENYNH